MGLSIVAGAGAVYLHHVAGSWVERRVDKVAEKAIDTASEAAHKATSMFFVYVGGVAEQRDEVRQERSREVQLARHQAQRREVGGALRREGKRCHRGWSLGR